MAQPPNTLTTPEPGLARLWEFVRGDLEARDFERWCYHEDTAETILGPTFQGLLNDTDFRDVVAIDKLRVWVESTLRARPNQVCFCLSVSNLGVVDMGAHQDVFASLQEVAVRGAPRWWLWAARCNACNQGWLIGSEERQNDVYCLRRISPETLSDIMERDQWPADFDRYETLLQIGRAAGRAVRFIEPLSSGSLVATIEDLARERPGIALSELAGLLNLELETARTIAIAIAGKERLAVDLDR